MAARLTRSPTWLQRPKTPRTPSIPVRTPTRTTIAGPADLSATPAEELRSAVSQVDLVGLVTYDFAGPWSGLTDLTAPIYRRTEGLEFSVDLIVSAWLEAGVPAAKLVVGYPLYGCRDEVLPSAERQWNETAHGAWVLTADDVFICFDDPDAVRAKAAYVRDRGLGGLSGLVARVRSTRGASRGRAGGARRIETHPRLGPYPEGPLAWPSVHEPARDIVSVGQTQVRS